MVVLMPIVSLTTITEEISDQLAELAISVTVTPSATLMELFDHRL